MKNDVILVISSVQAEAEWLSVEHFRQRISSLGARCSRGPWVPSASSIYQPGQTPASRGGRLQLALEKRGFEVRRSTYRRSFPVTTPPVLCVRFASVDSADGRSNP